MNEMDENSIQRALYYTREDCRERLGLSTLDIPSTPWETYSHLYLEIQKFLSSSGLMLLVARKFPSYCFWKLGAGGLMAGGLPA